MYWIYVKWNLNFTLFKYIFDRKEHIKIIQLPDED